MSGSDTEKSTSTELSQCKVCQKLYPAGSGWICPDDNGQLVPVGPDPLIGTVFDNKYEIQSVLGQGGMSTVYKARHKYMDRTVAVKLMSEHLVNDQTARLRFEQESKAASALSHQNIVSVHDFGITPNGQAYFVMDCLEGESLSDLLDREGRLAVDKSLAIFKQICDGLEPAHKLGMIHRDLKPSNVVLLIQDNGDTLVKIVDFGIAKFTKANAEGTPSQPRLTQTGEVFGSPMYMSPEQCQGHKLDPRSDIYSMGCLMYETLTGVAPYSGDSFIKIAMQHMSAPMPPFIETAPEAKIPPAIEEVVAKCMAKEPDNRFATIAEVRQAILDAALFSGVRGVRPGAVSDPALGRSPFKQTWDKFRVTFGNTAVKEVEKTASKMVSVTIGGAMAIMLIGGISFACIWPGPDNDRGTIWNKTHWMIDNALAHSYADSGKYEQAKNVLLEARALAMGFGDNGDRLKKTLEQLADCYGKLNMFDDQEKVNKDLIDLIVSEIKQEGKVAMKIVEALDPGSAQPSIKARNEALATSPRIISTTKRLHSRGLYPAEEQLLKKAITVYNKLGERQSVATFKIMLADCMMAEQRLSEVRPLLVEAVDITRRLLADYPDSKPAKQDFLNSLLRLGQFDRDQSDFEKSNVELGEALEVARKNFGKDASIMAITLNSYADLKRQMGNKEEYQKLTKEAQEFKPSANGVEDVGTGD